MVDRGQLDHRRDDATTSPTSTYTVAELPAGPAGKGTLQFTNCWGMAADSPNQEAALDLVEYLTSTEQQLAFSKAFGPMPSIQSAADDWSSDNPDLRAFLDGADYAQFPPNQAGAADVIDRLQRAARGLKTGDPQAILDSAQTNLEAVRRAADDDRPQVTRRRRRRAGSSADPARRGRRRLALHGPRARDPRRLPRSSRS